jgi:hypothetical protein
MKPVLSSTSAQILATGEARGQYYSPCFPTHPIDQLDNGIGKRKKEKGEKKGDPPRSACSYRPLMQLLTSPMLFIRVKFRNSTFIFDSRCCKSSQQRRHQ